jgi:hypothetical protein
MTELWILVTRSHIISDGDIWLITPTNDKLTWASTKVDQTLFRRPFCLTLWSMDMFTACVYNATPTLGKGQYSTIWCCDFENQNWVYLIKLNFKLFQHILLAINRILVYQNIKFLSGTFSKIHINSIFA